MKIKVKKPTVRRKNVSHVVISIYKSVFEKKENQVLLVGVLILIKLHPKKKKNYHSNKQADSGIRDNSLYSGFIELRHSCRANILT